jgi:hypothetical protein
MSDRWIIIAVLLAVLLLGTAVGTGVITVRGKALLPFEVVDGIVQDNPQDVADELRRLTGLDVGINTAALATAIESEAGGEPDAVKAAVGWAIRNHAGGDVYKIFKVLCPKGNFGAQNAGNSYAATSRPPALASVQLAVKVINGTIADATGGAEYFDSPKAQRAALARDTKGYTKTPEQVAESRRKSGLELVLIPGIPEERFRMWRESRKAVA